MILKEMNGKDEFDCSLLRRGAQSEGAAGGVMAAGGASGGEGRGGGRRRAPAPAAGAGGGPRAAVPAAGPARAPPDWAGLPRDLLEKIGRAVPRGGRLWFRLVCRSWAAAGARVAQVDAEGLPPGKVTRARGADAAASVARAEMVLDCLKGYLGLHIGAISDFQKFERGICEYAASGGHLAVLQWARAQGCPWDEKTCSSAAENGHLAVLQAI